MEEFYKYTLADFEKKRLSDLHDGDKVALGDWSNTNRYGAISIGEITHLGDFYALEFILPYGAKLRSNAHAEIQIDMSEEGAQIIRVTQYFSENVEVLVLRSEVGDD